jgi:hypothetical protein
LGIWRNIGKIVSLSCEIILLEIEWYLFGVHKKSSKKEKHDTHNNKVNSMNGEHSGVGSNYEPLNEEEESLERSKLMVELCEQPHLPHSGVGSNYEPLNDNELDW